MRCLNAMAAIFLGTLTAGAGYGQSRLLGDGYTVSLQNLPGDVGVVVDPETQFETDLGSEPLAVTFDGVEEIFGEVKINERVVAWPGQESGIHAVQATGIDGETEFDLTDWQNSGEIIEFSFSTTNSGYLSAFEDDQSFITIRDLQWDGAAEGIAAEFYLNSWYLYYTIDGQPFQGYEMQLPQLGLLVGPHPFDETVAEVAFIAYGSGQVEDIVDPIEGGVNLFFGTTQLDPVQGSWELLANVLGFSAIGFFNEIGDADGLHIGFLVKPPFLPVEGDFNNDQLLTAVDIDLLTAAVGSSDLTFDVNGDQSIDEEDRRVWVEELANTFFGDIDLNGDVQFSDFLTLSANFADNGGWGQGDFDGSGDVEFPDFLMLSANFGKTNVQPVAVPEPASVALFSSGVMGLLFGRRRC